MSAPTTRENANAPGSGGRACGVQGDWPFCGGTNRTVAAWEQREQKEENGVKGEADSAPLLNGEPPSEQGDPESGEERRSEASGNWKGGV